MQQNGEYWWPTFNGRVYYDKPLGSYWLVLAAAQLTGVVNELAARLPSAASAFAAVVFTMLLGRRLFGRRTAVFAGAILATSFGFSGFARTASADAETVAGVMAALWLFIRYEGRPGRWLYFFWLAMALTSLTKGLLGFALPLLVAALYSTWTGIVETDGGVFQRFVRANGWLLNRVTLVSAPLAMATYVLPFFLSPHAGGAVEGLAMVYRENVRRFFDPVNHRGPVYLYALVIFALLAPWSPLLPAALIRAHRRLRGPWRREHRFALSFFWAVFLFFTLSSSRRSYYLLPVLPAAALLVADIMAKPGAMLRRLTPRPRRATRAAAVVVYALQLLLFVAALPGIDGLRTQRPFADAVRDRLGQDLPELVLFRTSEIVFYLHAGAPLPEFSEPADLRRAATGGRALYAIVRRRDRNALGPEWSEEIAEPVQRWDGAERREAKLVLLRSLH
jgi:4-amino-4-deoxy-L-arabinose transferase-like glycosyltransferase